MGTLSPSFIVGIGGSAGGLNAYKGLLNALPSNTGMAFVIVTHIMPDASSQLAQLLSKRTKMKVMVATMGMPIRANHVYVSAPNADLRIENYTFKVLSPRSGRKPIDLFFTSLAEAMGARAIGIICSGYDGDGTEGCRDIKAKGGTTFAQDMSAEVESMPLSARASGSIDFVLPVDQISNELQRLVSAGPGERSAETKKQLTAVARILIAGTPDSVATIERILGQQYQFIAVSTMAEAVVQLKEEAFDLIMIGVHFDDSRMFELLPRVRATPEQSGKPIICFATRDTPLTRTMNETIDMVSKKLGAWMYLDQYDYSICKDPDAEIRRIIKRCLTGETRKKTQSSRVDIQKQREEIQRQREALEVQEWSENVEDRVIELRRILESLLLELWESNVNTVSQQEQIVDSREQKDRVSEAVKLGEDGAAIKEKMLLLDETKQTDKEVDLDEKEEKKRKKGRRSKGDDKGSAQ
ncbi:hypothetical protein BH10CYA1_BH10CYA1_63320 [soil metagenome]